MWTYTSVTLHPCAPPQAIWLVNSRWRTISGGTTIPTSLNVFVFHLHSGLNESREVCFMLEMNSKVRKLAVLAFFVFELTVVSF